MDTYAVKLPDCPRLIVAADDRLGAIQAYRKFCGILKTEHDFAIEDAKGEVNAAPFPKVISAD